MKKNWLVKIFAILLFVFSSNVYAAQIRLIKAGGTGTLRVYTGSNQTISDPGGTSDAYLTCSGTCQSLPVIEDVLNWAEGNGAAWSWISANKDNTYYDGHWCTQPRGEGTCYGAGGDFNGSAINETILYAAWVCIDGWYATGTYSCAKAGANYWSPQRYMLINGYTYLPNNRYKCPTNYSSTGETNSLITSCLGARSSVGGELLIRIL